MNREPAPKCGGAGLARSLAAGSPGLIRGSGVSDGTAGVRVLAPGAWGGACWAAAQRRRRRRQTCQNWQGLAGGRALLPTLSAFSPFAHACSNPGGAEPCDTRLLGHTAGPAEPHPCSLAPHTVNERVRSSGRCACRRGACHRRRRRCRRRGPACSRRAAAEHGRGSIPWQLLRRAVALCQRRLQVCSSAGAVGKGPSAPARHLAAPLGVFALPKLRASCLHPKQPATHLLECNQLALTLIGCCYPAAPSWATPFCAAWWTAACLKQHSASTSRRTCCT